MKTIGIIGGTSWESTQEYYRLLNREVNKRLGGKHSAKIIMYSFDFEEIDRRNRVDDLEGIGKRLIEEAVKLENAGAELLMLGANTAHLWADKIQEKISIPIVHIADAIGKAINKTGVKRVLLLGTDRTMEGDFIKGRLKNNYGVEVVIPDRERIKRINYIIYEELVRGMFEDSSREYLLHTIGKQDYIEGVILGCTELPLIIKDSDCDYPLFNTTALHANAVADLALSK